MGFYWSQSAHWVVLSPNCFALSYTEQSVSAFAHKNGMSSICSIFYYFWQGDKRDGDKSPYTMRIPSQPARGLKWHDQGFYSKQHLGETEFSLMIIQLHQCLSFLPHWRYLLSDLPLTQTHHTDPTSTQQNWEKDGRMKLRALLWLSRALSQSSAEGHIL